MSTLVMQVLNERLLILLEIIEHGNLLLPSSCSYAAGYFKLNEVARAVIVGKKPGVKYMLVFVAVENKYRERGGRNVAIVHTFESHRYTNQFKVL